MKQISHITLEEFFPYFEQHTVSCVKGGQGRTQKRRCCYHHEDTGSAMVFEKNDGGVVYHCFGCGVTVSPVQFLHDRGLSWSDAYQTFNITKNSDNSHKIDVINFKKFDKVTLFTDKFRGSIPNGYQLDEKDIYTFHVPVESDLITYYKVVFRFGKKKEIRQGYFNDNHEFLYEKPENPVYFNYCKALQWRENKLNNKSYQAKLIITEGEKDCITLEKLSSDIKYVPISLKGMSEAQAKKWMKELLDGLESEVYFIGDEDLAGLDYRDFCFEACKNYVEHFYIINLSRLTNDLFEGMDVTDWVNTQSEMVKARREFQKTVTSLYVLHDYKLCKRWSNLELKGTGKNETYRAEAVIYNLESFFQEHRCLIKQEEISKCFRGDFGLLSCIQDKNQFHLPMNFYSLRDLLREPVIVNGRKVEGMKILKINNLELEVQRLLERKKFNDMLDTINHPPVNNNFVQTITFSWKEEGCDKIAESYAYEVPELLDVLLENIEFVSKDQNEIKLQKILIYKALLACPAVLRNNALHQESIKGDLRLIGANSIGKTDFVSALFGEGFNYSKYGISWFNKMYRFDVGCIDHQKIAASSPCVFLDEGNITGKASEQRASMDNMTVRFIEKYETRQTTIIKRGIIVSASNHKDVSIDIHAERRMWAVEVAKLPWLRKMSCSKYYNSPSQRKFWDQYLKKDDFFEVTYEDGNVEKFFRFPVLEFWKQMNALYLYYYGRGEWSRVSKMNGTYSTGELGFYKSIWMQDKYVVNDIENEIQRAHNWEEPAIKIPVNIWRSACAIVFGKAFCEAEYKRVIDIKTRANCSLSNGNARVYYQRYNPTELKYEKVQGSYVLLPPFAKEFVDTIKIYHHSNPFHERTAMTKYVDTYSEYKMTGELVKLTAANEQSAWN